MVLNLKIEPSREEVAYSATPVGRSQYLHLTNP